MSEAATPESAVLDALYRGDATAAEEEARGGGELDVLEAAALGRAERLRQLLDEDPGAAAARSPDGFTPLHYAAFFGRPEAARLLLGRGALVDAVADNPMRVQPLHSAVAGDHVEIAQALLEHGADANAVQERGFRPLHAAAQNGSADLVDVLLAHDADPALAADDGRTAADFAREAGHEALAARFA